MFKLKTNKMISKIMITKVIFENLSKDILMDEMNQKFKLNEYEPNSFLLLFDGFEDLDFFRRGTRYELLNNFSNIFPLYEINEKTIKFKTFFNFDKNKWSAIVSGLDN